MLNVQKSKDQCASLGSGERRNYLKIYLFKIKYKNNLSK